MNYVGRTREVSLVVLDSTGLPLGTLPPFPVRVPYLQEVAVIVDGARIAYGIEVAVLRLLAVDDKPPALRTWYAVELPRGAVVPGQLLRAWPPLANSWLRLPWASPGGPAAELDWARTALHAIGCTVRRDVQVRSWNLSAIWRLETDRGDYWLKCVPPFMAHEGALITALAGERVPALVATDRYRTLMPALPGSDRYDAGLDEIRNMVTLLVDLQWRLHVRVDELLALGVPDMRTPVLIARLRHVYERHRDALANDARAVMDRFVSSLEDHFAAIADCGLPDTLVHGDFHPGNVRGGAQGDGTTAVILDWGDAVIGNPLLDLPGLLHRVDPAWYEPLLAHWQVCWRAHVPGTDIEAASRLVEPVATLRNAWVFQMFLDRIERSEHVYHASDPLDCIQRAAALLTQPGARANDGAV